MTKKYLYPLSFICAFLSITSLQAAEEQLRALSVTGQGKAFVTPTLADIRIGIETVDVDAINVQQNLALLASKVYSVLKQAQAQRLQTGSMQIYPEYSKDNPPVIVRYRGQVEITFSAPIDKAGAYIDMAIASGANKMNGFSVRPEDDELMRTRLEALHKASVNALQEASTVLKSLGIEGKKIIKVNVNPAHPTPIYRPYPMAMAAKTSAAPETEIVTTEQEVDATVEIFIGLD